jgi:hypothetical protein
MKVNLTKIIALVGILPTLVSSIKGLVTEFEDDKSTGEEKKNSVLEALDIALKTGEILVDIDLPNEAILSVADKLIDLVVEIKNKIGEFTHKSTATTAAES